MRGRQVLDESFLLLFNGHHEDHTFTLPDGAFGDAWTVVLDTRGPRSSRGEETLEAGERARARPPLASSCCAATQP